jgi:uncharacterized protein YndB with AHSA1/START domain
VKLAVHQLVIRAEPDDIFDLLVDPALIVSWMADDATLDPTPGGIVRWSHPNGDTVSGPYVTIDRPHRLVFTYGWERIDVGIRPGSTTVEITLAPQPGGSTVVKLVQSGLSDSSAGAHEGVGRTTWVGCGEAPRANDSTCPRDSILESGRATA